MGRKKDDNFGFEDSRFDNEEMEVRRPYQPEQSLVDPDNINDSINKKVKLSTNQEVRKPGQPEQSLVEEVDGRKRFKSRKCVADLSKALKDKTKSKAAYKKSQLYLGSLWLMSIFYSLPTIQMVFRLSHQQEISGNHDICYYNELCRRSLGSLSDFNHMFREKFI